ncbi:MAG: hypothetical protein M1469_02055 [Bacteroidetes bacterium]|nr:hypothetical protein [Bacteroidota bacterium]
MKYLTVKQARNILLNSQPCVAPVVQPEAEPVGVADDAKCVNEVRLYLEERFR